MSLFKSILRFKEIEKDCERFLVQSKKAIVDVVNIALANLKFHTMHATSEYICNICVMVSSRREIICSRTWKITEIYGNQKVGLAFLLKNSGKVYPGCQRSSRSPAARNFRV